MGHYGMKRLFITFLLVILLAAIGMVGMRSLTPMSFHTLLITFDLTPDAAAEKARLNKISLLAISDEKKNILIHNTVFMGASTAMVKLALGTPVSIERLEQSTPVIDRWIYHFADDSRPTVLEFNDNKLVSAYKISAHKLNLGQKE